MASIDLLRINSNKLFQDYSIEEIEKIQKLLHNEIERKKEVLRTMVGEKYRDMIDAVDTISDMKTTADDVIDHIDCMSSKCRQLQQTHLVGFNAKEFSNINVNDPKDYIALALQIKILMAIPEKICTYLEKKDFLHAAELFLFAQQINTGLPMLMHADRSLHRRFPVVNQAWRSIASCLSNINLECRESLAVADLDPLVAAKSLATLALLENPDPLFLLEQLLNLRTRALEAVLDPHQSQFSVTSQLCTSLQLLTQTITLLHICFIEENQNSPGLIIKLLKELSEPGYQSCLALVGFSNHGGGIHLPRIVREYKTFADTSSFTELSITLLQEKAVNWLKKSGEFVAIRVQALLDLVTSIHALHSLREAASRLQTPTSFKYACRRLELPDDWVAIWQTLYQPLLTIRAKQLITSLLHSAVKTLDSTLSNSLKELKTDGKSEADLRWFIWKESFQDLQQKNGFSSLSMKTRGYSPRVQNICSVFEEKIQSLLKDVEPYFDDKMNTEDLTAESDLPNFQRFMDKSQLEDHLRETTLKSLTMLMNLCVQLIKSEEERSIGEIILVARLLQSIPDLCPGIKQCLALAGKGHQAWATACAQLEAKCLEVWTIWCKVFIKELQTKAEIAAKEALRPEIALTKWEKIIMEGLESSGNAEIYVPQQPSLWLQSFLLNASEHVAALAPHTIPRTIHQDLCTELASHLLDLIETYSVALLDSQNHVMQFVLDLKYIVMLLGSRDNKALNYKFQTIIDKLEDKIDPFDLDVFIPYVTINVEKSVARTQCLFGVLSPWPDKLKKHSKENNEQDSKKSNVNNIENPNILQMAKSVGWFPLLPVTWSSSSNRQTAANFSSDKVLAINKTTSKNKTESSTADLMRSGAAALFGAMSSDWFGSN